MPAARLTRRELIEKAARIAEWPGCTCTSHGAATEPGPGEAHLHVCPMAIGAQIREELAGEAED